MGFDGIRAECARCHAPRDLDGSDGAGWSGPSGSCPGCGSSESVVCVSLSDTVATPREALGFVATDETTGRKHRGHARWEPTRTGPLAGTLAWVEQQVDKIGRPGWYRKRVTLSDGTIAKDVDGPLTDQSLHGPQPRH